MNARRCLILGFSALIGAPSVFASAMPVTSFYCTANAQAPRNYYLTGIFPAGADRRDVISAWRLYLESQGINPGPGPSCQAGDPATLKQSADVTRQAAAANPRGPRLVELDWRFAVGDVPPSDPNLLYGYCQSGTSVADATFFSDVFGLTRGDAARNPAVVPFFQFVRARFGDVPGLGAGGSPGLEPGDQWCTMIGNIADAQRNKNVWQQKLRGPARAIIETGWRYGVSPTGATGASAASGGGAVGVGVTGSAGIGAPAGVNAPAGGAGAATSGSAAGAAAAGAGVAAAPGASAGGAPAGGNAPAGGGGAAAAGSAAGAAAAGAGTAPSASVGGAPAEGGAAAFGWTAGAAVGAGAGAMSEQTGRAFYYCMASSADGAYNYFTQVLVLEADVRDVQSAWRRHLSVGRTPGVVETRGPFNCESGPGTAMQKNHDLYRARAEEQVRAFGKAPHAVVDVDWRFPPG